jgi:hypothetical protein
MRSWKSRWLDRLLLLVCALWFGGVQAETIALNDVELGIGDSGYELDFNADFELATHLEQMVGRGVTLTFRVEFEVFRPRWYWFDERVVRRNLNYRLSYQELTRQYRVASGNFQQSFPTLRQALRQLSSVRHWQVAERDDLHPGDQYHARLRYFLDTSQLPKPLQLSAFTSSEWDLGSETRAWTFVAGLAEGSTK